MEINVTEDSPSEPPSKRHKKHKKKHKRKTKESEDEGSLTSPKTSIKLKLKIGSETMGTKNFASIVQSEVDESVSEAADEKPMKKSDDNSDEDLSEEEKWLNALEKGTLNSYGEIGSAKKDPAQLTARQRSLLHGNQQDELLQLPSGYKTVELTDEQKQLRQEKAKKRRQQANEKMEYDKNLTVHKLLKKQDSKLRRAGKGRGCKRSNIPRVMYRDNPSGISVSLPPEMNFPMAADKSESYPETEQCGVDGCTNHKTSVCSKSLVPVCGLECYKKNLL